MPLGERSGGSVRRSMRRPTSIRKYPSSPDTKPHSNCSLSSFPTIFPTPLSLNSLRAISEGVLSEAVTSPAAAASTTNRRTGSPEDAVIRSRLTLLKGFRDELPHETELAPRSRKSATRTDPLAFIITLQILWCDNILTYPEAARKYFPFSGIGSP